MSTVVIYLPLPPHEHCGGVVVGGVEGDCHQLGEEAVEGEARHLETVN